MRKIILPIVAMLFTLCVNAQHTFKGKILDSAGNQPLLGATAVLKGTTNGAMADDKGQVEITNIPTGQQTIVFKYLGYEEQEMTLLFPVTNDSAVVTVLLKTAGEELEEITISTTRTSRNIEDEPTRVEAIELEEIDEKANMRPSNVSMILHESTGIQVQQTSATSANASIRIQGLDGRYTQLLKDGYPNFGNFAGGLSILEIPPLDLKQVEIIKGPASTLYGGGAIAGMVNFVSKTPQQKAEYNFIINQSHVGQTNIGAFASGRNSKMGFTVLALGNYQKAYDVDEDDFTELPRSVDYTIHPKLFLYPSGKTTITIGNSFTQGDRKGGDIHVVQGEADTIHTYFEKNKTLRNISTVELAQQLKEKDRLTARSSLSYFNRRITMPAYLFEGTNYNSYSDISYVHAGEKQTFIVGANFVYDNFRENFTTGYTVRDFNSKEGGMYAQHTWDATDKVKLESGLRADMVNYGNSNYSKTEFFVLPRVSALFKISDKVSSRIGGGLGYKTPTVFTEETEAVQYRNVLPLNNVTAERSYGGTADINYKTALGSDFYFTVNQMFFYTLIHNASVLTADTTGGLFFMNTNKPVTSTGFETNAKLIYKENFKFFAGYTFTYAKAEYLTGNRFISLTPKNKLNLALVYEKEKNIKLGLEGYFTDRQYLNNGTRSSSYWEFGAMIEKFFGKFSVYVNAENFTDTRQSKYKRVVNEPHNNPTFDDIWTHTEGFVLSAGVKVKL